MTSLAGRFLDIADSIQNPSQCVLAYTLTHSECARTILENNLEDDGWEKTGHKMETHWMAEKPAAEFMTRKAGPHLSG